jgi:hypothetical protein
MVKGQMAYYAQFKPVDNHTFRLNTRIYLSVCDKPSECDKECIAAVVLKNPGKATWRSESQAWEPLILDGDKTLPMIHGLFWDAYAKASKPIPENAFIQVWNLFYLCNHEANAAFRALKTISAPPGVCPRITVSRNWFGSHGASAIPVIARRKSILIP